MRHLRHLGPLARRHWPNLALALIVAVASVHVVPELVSFLGRHTAAAARAVTPKADPPPPQAAPAVRQAPSMVWPLPQAAAEPTATLPASEAPGAPLPPPAPAAPLPPPLSPR